MRLLRLRSNDQLSITHDITDDIPPYAILSHTWARDGEEVTHQDVLEKRGTEKAGYQKILFCGQQAKRDGLEHFWVDTCCIDKTSSAELTEAINSMFRWYRNAVHCYVYLSDVLQAPDQALDLWETQFRLSKWFTRGWTLQELLAPVSVQFFSAGGIFLGDRLSLENKIHGITKIKIPALRRSPLDHFSVLERMSWSDNRQTTKEEDAAYCLLGIFDVNIPLIYGEGEAKAMSRLRKAIEEQTGISHSPPHQDKRTESGLNLAAFHLTPEVAYKSHLMVPFGQNEEFVGREIILAELVRKISPSAVKNDCQRTVLEGLGGVGKTQIALEAAYRVLEQDPDCSVFWVPAITAVTFENAYKQIGEALGTPGIDDKKADVKALVKVALDNSIFRWLLIVDNVDDIALLTSRGLQDYLPFNRKGSILYTTRNHEIAVRLDVSTKSIYEVGEMSQVEALELLQSGLKERQYRDVQATGNLLNHLVCLPLAIKQASAYMARTRITTAVYLKHYLKSDEAEMELLNAEFEDRWRYSKSTNPINTTWLVSFHHLAQSYPLAVEYLKFICLLAEKDIPISLLPPGKDEKTKIEAVGILEGYAFINMQEPGDSFDIHRLVRLATRNWIKSEWESCCTNVIRHLAQEFPFPEHKNKQLWTRYMPHAEMVLQLHEWCTDKKAAACFLFNVANSYDELAKYAKAEQIQRQTLELYKAILGPESPLTLDSMNNLALVLDSQGKYEEAETMHWQTLKLYKAVLGPESPSALGSMNNLALVLDIQGKYEEAEAMHRQTLELCKAVLGPESPPTLDSMNNLALVLDSQGKYEEAEVMHHQTLELYKAVLGPESPSALDSMDNLSIVFRKQGKYDEAEAMHRQTLKLKKVVMGPESPSTLDSMHNLALVFRKQKKYDEAEAMHRQTLELKKVVLGPESPSTLDSMHNLALVFRKQEKYDEAEAMLLQTLELYKMVLGPESPSTLDSMHNLALVYRKQGKYDEAEAMLLQTLELYTKVIGPKSVATLDNMNNLALVLDSQGKFVEAEALYRKTIELKKAVLGLYHPSTTKAERNLQRFLNERRESFSETSNDSEGEGGVAL